MTGTSKQFVIDFLLAHPTPGKVLEIGSRNVNGTVKYLFKDGGWQYTGLDMINGGEFTDIVCNAHDLKKKLEKESFDLVVCLDTLEHDDKFWLTVNNMRWVLKKGGWMIIIVPSISCPVHDWPSDYYRFLLPVMQEVWFEGFSNCFFKSFGAEERPDAIYGWGQK